MTPKEKAIELFAKNLELLIHSGLRLHPSELIAKKSALIAVDEILKNSVGYNAYDGVTDNDIWADVDYWGQVKKEIEKL